MIYFVLEVDIYLNQFQSQLRIFSHPNVLPVLGCCNSPPNLVILIIIMILMMVMIIYWWWLRTSSKSTDIGKYLSIYFTKPYNLWLSIYHFDFLQGGDISVYAAPHLTNIFLGRRYIYLIFSKVVISQYMPVGSLHTVLHQGTGYKFYLIIIIIVGVIIFLLIIIIVVVIIISLITIIIVSVIIVFWIIIINIAG